MTPGILINKLTNSGLPDFMQLVQLFGNVFEMENFAIPNAAYLTDLLAKPNFMVLVAKRGDEVVGGLTAYILDQYYSKKPLVYIYDLAVQQQYQRQGIGKMLIGYLKEYCQEKGFEEVFVQADEVDDHALEFYRSTQVTQEEKVVHFYYSLTGNKKG